MPSKRAYLARPVLLATAAVAVALVVRAGEQAAPSGAAAPADKVEKPAAPIRTKAVKIDKGVDILRVRNFFIPDPGPEPKPKEPATKDPPPVVVGPDPADKVVATGIVRFGSTWLAVLEEVEVRRGHFVAAGETVPGLPNWQLERIDHERERLHFRNRGAPADVALGSNLTGRNTAAVEKIMSAGRAVSAAAAATPTAPTTTVAASSKGGRFEKGKKDGGASKDAGPSTVARPAEIGPIPPVGPGAEPAAGERVNRESGISEDDARFLEQYLPDREKKSGRR